MLKKNKISKKIKKTVIIPGYRCNNNCLFCLNIHKRNSIPQKTTNQVKKEMIEAKNSGTTYLELVGGEMSIRPDIIELIEFAKELGFETIMMSTNGRMYSYKKFAEEIVKAGLNSLIFSIHGHNAKLHDSLTQVPGSFEQLKKGIENVKKAGLKDIGSNTTIVKQNYKNLPEIGKLIYNLGIRNSEFIFVDPTYGAAYDDFYKFVPKISEATPYIHKCLDVGKIHKIPHWAVRYVPLCYFTDYLNQISELKEVVIFHTEHLAPDFENRDVEKARRIVGRAKTKRCKGCKLYDKCEGIWKEYLKHYGDKEFFPVNKNIKINKKYA